MSIDINCDTGEGIGNDGALMPFITSANIACGYHAGDTETITATIQLAKKHGVAIGAHPSFLDRENFGRTNKACTPAQVYQLVQDQLRLFIQLARQEGTDVHHVKPHGALYNMAAEKATLAKAIATAVKDIDNNLVLYGLSSSHLISEAAAIGLLTRSEVFADRTYQDNGSLTPRTAPNALIEEAPTAVKQVLQMVQQGTVTTCSGKIIQILAETVCIHGDGKEAVTLTRQIFDTLQQHHLVQKTL